MKIARAYGRDGTYKRHRHDLLDAGSKIRAQFPDLNVSITFIWMGHSANGTSPGGSRTLYPIDYFVTALFQPRMIRINTHDTFLVITPRCGA
jgi:hypothetical protein